MDIDKLIPEKAAASEQAGFSSLMDIDKLIRKWLLYIRGFVLVL